MLTPTFLLFSSLSIYNLPGKVVDFIIEKHLPIISKFVLTREDFIKRQQEKLPNGINSYYYAFKYLYPYPFIYFRSKTYLPLPHLVIDAATESLLNRLTDDNNTLRSIIGKEVIEEYLYYILDSSNVYSEVVREFKYNIGKRQLYTPDVMVCKNNKCILFDCKSSVPAIKLREFDKVSIEQTIQQCAQNIVQLYKRINEIKYYKPFTSFDYNERENIFGVVVLLEENYIAKRKIYSAAIKLLGFEENSEEDIFLKSNIKIMGLVDIEGVIFRSKDYIDCLVANKADKTQWYNITMNNYTSQELKNSQRIEPIENFIQKLKLLIRKFADDLIAEGIIQPLETLHTQD